ncbi:GNAT family N-acetyltransferase [Rubellimicrobium aerolatum]|uniref:GNAT family N-acetyltransferase n=1 Tax=Rubellimicrobium aerolatum TaxID=490979 RepID=A0ABW0SAV6_9RHOB|nr:GNAT family N-acetyltransferase [Rubellimicrobium aerolatum]MBP1806135.1 ribosomal protein S18 acetylase RimI-like enzyme [Rubellimicrobium aerolatum]
MIRAATADDARAISELAVATWRHAYAGLLPKKVLAGLSMERGTANWRAVIETPGGAAVAVALDGDAIAGFVCHGPQRDDGLRAAGHDGEVLALYVAPAIQGRGLGRRLMVRAARDLRDRGCRGLGLWTLRDNHPARAFYERLGGSPGIEKVGAVAGHPVTDVAYTWPTLDDIA